MDRRKKTEELVSRFLLLWSQTIQQCSMYGQNHQVTVLAISKLYKILLIILQNLKDLNLGIIENEFFFERQPLCEISRKMKSFITNLTKMGISKIVFKSGIQEEDLGIMIKLMTFNIHSEDGVRLLNDVLQKKGICHIKISELNTDTNLLFNDDIVDVDDFTHESVQRGIQFLRKSMKTLTKKGEIDGGVLKQIAAGLVNSLLINKQLLLMLTSLKLHDEDLFLHNMNVCILTMMQAELLGLDNKFLIDIAGAALMHNIGFMLTQSEDKLKTYLPGEYNVVNNALGSKAIMRMQESSLLSAITAYECNMNYKLNTSCLKKHGSDLNLISMMITISCHYDSFRRNSAFYKENGAEKIFDKMMAEKGGVYQPDLLNNFFAVLGKYPPGTLVKLDSGEIALVIQASFLDLCRPKVEIIYNEEGEPLNDTESFCLIKKNRHGRFAKSIVQSINPVHSPYIIPDKLITVNLSEKAGLLC